jgi:beta-glucosidase
MAEATFYFPKNFLWGTASSGHQVEGNDTNSDWWSWEQTPGHIAEGQRAGNACDWWNGRRWQEDFDRAAADGHTTHRMSVEWSRIEPTLGRWDDDALDHYRQMVQGLKARGLEPMVTLHHFSNPQWLMERRMWETGEAVALFERYTRKVVGALGADVRLWCTINEPNAYMVEGWVDGLFPAHQKNINLALKVAYHLLRAHSAAYRAIHALQPQALVGLPIHFRPIQPASSWAFDRWVAQTQFNLGVGLLPDAIHTGRLRRLVGSVAVPEAKGTLDYFGLNYYTADVARFDPTCPGQLFGRRSFPPGAEVDDAKVYASYPPGLGWSLRWIHDRFKKLPIYITENGIGDAADRMRPRYILSHLRELLRYVNFNWDIRGYYHWSLVDNFEWERGWTHRFGLYALNPDTQERTPRSSATLYAEICHTRSISSGLVARYAPELSARLFPDG